MCSRPYGRGSTPLLSHSITHLRPSPTHLAGASLAVGKDADLVAVQCRLHQLADLLKHLALQGGQ